MPTVVDGNPMTISDPNGSQAQLPRRRRSKVWEPHAVWAGIIVFPFVAWMLWLSQTELPEGTCSGIGWGCELAGWDAVGIALLFVGIPLLLVLLAGHAIIGLAQWIRSRRYGGS
jgi:phosphoglycerol transferase MdoB-like AlkP superfamily enzyme